MPLYPSAMDLVRIQLESIAKGEPVRLIVIGQLSAAQHQAINEARANHDLPKLESPEIVYLGRHHFKSRVVEDGYALEDLYHQVEHALAASAEVRVTQRSTTLVSVVEREDGYGFIVRDTAVLELNSRKPRAELFSAIPKGDGGGPKKRQSR